jgi:AcrR family transcriptional regulator
MDPVDALPPSLAIAWGLRGRPRKGPKPLLTLERIVEAAVALAAAEGMDAVSMSRVAGELGVSTMSLYRYVAAKDELTLLMMDAAFVPGPPEPAADPGWRPRLYQWSWSHLDVLRANAWVLGIVLHSPPSGPNQIAWMERGLAYLRDTGLSEREKLSVVVLLTGYVRNWALLSAGAASAEPGGGLRTEAGCPTHDDSIASYGNTLAALIDPVRFPALSAVIAAGVMTTPGDPDEEFVFGLERFLDGIEMQIERRRTGGGPAGAAGNGAGV